MKVLINFGSTRSYIDPVRFLTNASSGKTGILLAYALEDCYFNVKAIVGDAKVNLKKLNYERAYTNEAMLKAMQKEINEADVVIFCAAIADYKPQVFSEQKIQKAQYPNLNIKLEPNLNIIGELAKNKKTHQIWIGFSCQEDWSITTAYQKLINSSLDYLLINLRNVINSHNTHLKMINSQKTILWEKQGPKKEVMPELAYYIKELLQKNSYE